MKFFKSISASLTKGLQKTSDVLNKDITELFTTKPLDDEMLEALEDSLIIADLGPKAAMELTSELRRDRFGKELSADDVRAFIADNLAKRLEGANAPEFEPKSKPHVILVVGVNGSGKTTSMGKIAHFLSKDYKVQMAAGDTFRAAAVEQLLVWGERAGIPVFSKGPGADSGAVAYEAYDKARKDNADILMIDTAGRLHNKSDLMAELAKMRRVIQKQDEHAPHDTWLVLDATTGQNALAQAQAFNEITPLTGLIVTKLDGTAKAGIILPLWEQFKLPIVAIGVGEKLEDLQEFNAQSYAKNLLGVYKDVD